ncbi:hypothetical protein DTW91_07280 [Chryseobacterium sp. SC28]|nr:hypothetical protein DTW91_07280 [Chryseobacterium sp. SC28]
MLQVSSKALRKKHPFSEQDSNTSRTLLQEKPFFGVFNRRKIECCERGFVYFFYSDFTIFEIYA